MKVVILHDHVPPDAPPELQDNLAQVGLVHRTLTDLGHESIRLPMARTLTETSNRLQDLAPDRVFNLVESVWGSGRWIHLVPALVERLGIPCAGNASRAVLETTNKLKSKERLRQAGLPTPEWITFGDDCPEEVTSMRYIIKSIWEHGSLGLDETSVRPADELYGLRREMEHRRHALGGDCYAEEYIDGREFNLSVLAGDKGPEVLPPAEIVFLGYGPEMTRIVGYRAKWVADSHEYSHTPRRFEPAAEDEALVRSLIDLSRRCWDLFRLRGWARVDFRVDPSGRPFILEVNTNPCLSDDAGFMAAARQAGLAPKTVIDRVLRDVPSL